MGFEIRPGVTADDALRGLDEIFQDVQEKFHDQWDWMSAHFYLEVLKTCIRVPTEQRITLTPRDVAQICGFGITATYKMLADGTMPSIRVGNRFYIPRAALQQWLASCGSPSKDEMR